MGKHQAFRANVGVVVTNEHGDVAVFERRNQPGQWQLPQGGLDVGEEPLDAAYRELLEETGLGREDVEHLGTHPRWLAYDLPPALRRKHWRGQVQRWFLFCIRPGKVIDLALAHDDEFTAHRWAPMRHIIDEVWEVRRPIYEEIARYFEL